MELINMNYSTINQKYHLKINRTINSPLYNEILGSKRWNHSDWANYSSMISNTFSYTKNLQI